MFLHWPIFLIVLLGDYVHTKDIYLTNQCTHFLSKIFICKKATNDEVVTPFFVQTINRRGQNIDEKPVPILPNPWVSLLTRKFRLKWSNQKEY